MIPAEEMALKFKAAVKARQDEDFLFIARTDARGVAGGSVEDTIERAKAYIDAGVDMIFPEGLTSKDEIAEVCAALDTKIHYNRTGVSPMLTLDEIDELGIAMVGFATGALRSGADEILHRTHDVNGVAVPCVGIGDGGNSHRTDDIARHHHHFIERHQPAIGLTQKRRRNRVARHAETFETRRLYNPRR